MESKSFIVLDASVPSELEQWITLWKSWPKREVFAHPHYATLFSKPTDRVVCAAMVSEEGCILYPFILRDLTTEAYCGANLSPAVDMITPYGYGGPCYWGDGDPEKLANLFWDSFNQWAEKQGVVSEFIRFTLFKETLLQYPGEIEEKQQNVVRNLDLDKETLWMDFEHKVRKNVKKAQRSGVTIEVDTKGERLEEFLQIYLSTMDRRDANQGYYFTRGFFEKIQSNLSDQSVYFHAIHEGKVISTELVLVSAENIYSYLGGTDSEYFELRPNDLLKYEVMLWAKTQGKKNFVLGGGYQPDDGIFRYKLAFAPHGVIPFYVGHRIIRRDINDQLVENKKRLFQGTDQEWSPRPDFFPPYRS